MHVLILYSFNPGSDDMLAKSRALALLLIIMSVLLFASCSPKKVESADICTTLSIDSSFSGARTIVLTFPESIVAQGSDGEANLDKVVDQVTASMGKDAQCSVT